MAGPIADTLDGSFRGARFISLSFYLIREDSMRKSPGFSAFVPCDRGNGHCHKHANGLAVSAAEIAGDTRQLLAFFRREMRADLLHLIGSKWIPESRHRGVEL